MRVGKRLAEFAKTRREGILVFNKEEAGKEHPEFQGERKQRKYFELVKCSSCSKVISKNFFSNHKRYCTRKTDSTIVSLPMSIQVMPANLSLSKDFVNKILSKFRTDKKQYY